MGRQLKELDPARSHAHRLGAELRKWRLRAGLSQDAVGAATCHSGALVGKIERGERVAGLGFCAGADAVLRSGGALQRLWSAGGGDTAVDGVVDAPVPRLRRALGRIGVGDDGPSPDVEDLAQRVRCATSDRLHARYDDLAESVPDLIVRLATAELRTGRDQDRRRLAALMTLTLRAADGLAFKLGHHDLSARLIDLMTARAHATDDPAMIATAAYVATETYFVTGDLTTGYRALVMAIDGMDPAVAGNLRASAGALHMRAAVVCARLGRADTAADHLDAARHAAERTPEGVYGGTAFGPDSLRIHRLAVAAELHDAATVQRATSWCPPAALPAERRSHYFIDLGRAQFALGRYAESRESLRTASAIAPQHTRQHPQVRRIDAALRETGRRNRRSAPAVE